MRFSVGTPPYVAPTASVGAMMLRVLVAMTPGVAAQVWFFGPGVLIQLGLAVVSAEAAEALVLKLRGRRVVPVLRDGSAVLTAALLAVSLPPLLPWPMTALGTVFAVVIGKQLYGGLGFNPFNPAMLGYAMLLVSFPKSMTQWLPSADLATVHLSFAETAEAVLFRRLPGDLGFDAISGATPLDVVRTGLTLHRSMGEIQSEWVFGGPLVSNWAWVNIAYLVGGLGLWRVGVIGWQIPAAFLGSMTLLSLLFFTIDPGAYASPGFHLSNGATMLGAFFIATDPVSAATTTRGRWIYGGLIGTLVYTIRVFGGYPDGVAFAVLLANLAAPSIDHWSRPRFGPESR